ncbi:MAG TPA: hypothetical protein VMZ27_11285 [Candidatus Saccharimonadales bacterium]|nr:hypothetical protein [Candidatus Saccharimonadales bacterium]
MRNSGLFYFVFAGGLFVLISISMWRYIVGVLALCGVYYLYHLYHGKRP